MDSLLLFELWLGVCLSAAVVSSVSDSELPKAENVHWVSLDFKTVLKWSAPPSDYTYTVSYSDDGAFTFDHSGLWDAPGSIAWKVFTADGASKLTNQLILERPRDHCDRKKESHADHSYSRWVTIRGDDGDWNTSPECIEKSDTECDLTDDIMYHDRTFTADVVTEGIGDFDPEDFPHTYSTPFNPYRQSELSAVSFTIQKVAERSVTLNISDPLTGIHVRDKQLTIRDVLKKDLKYKVSYYKSASTGMRNLVVDSNLPQIPNLDPGQSYCFMVAAFVPSRAKAVQQGSWSPQTCTSGSNILDGVELGTVFQAIFIPLVLLVVLVTVIVIYCRCCRGKRKPTNAEDVQQPTAQYTVV